MRAPSFSNIFRVTALSVMLCAVVKLAVADVGGGKGYPETPWRREGPKSVLDLEKAKEEAASYQNLSISIKLVVEKMEGVLSAFQHGKHFDLTALTRVALVPAPFREADIAIYELVGKTNFGETVAISFSQIESFTVMSKNEKTITLSVMVWPEISPEQLLEEQPTYKQLYEGYRRNVTLDLDLESADGRPLVFRGQWGLTSLPLDKLPVDTKGSFYEAVLKVATDPRQFWWAIPSVTNDEAYPYRLIPEH